MSEQHEQQPGSVERRRFLQGAALAVAASAAGGTGLAIWNTRQQPVQTVAPAPPVIQQVVTPASDPNEMLAQLASVQAENMRLQSELDAANRRLEIAEIGRSDADTERTELKKELTEATTQIGLMAGLVALYDQLETFDLGETVTNGIGQLTDGFTALVDELPGLTDGIAEGEIVLSRFEADIPSLEEGRAWLEENTAEVATRWDTMKESLASVVENTASGVLAMLSSWFTRLLGWVPFEFGNRARATMDSIFSFMSTTPTTIAGTNEIVLARWNKWFAKGVDDDDLPVRQAVLTPIREGVLQAASATAPKIEAAQTLFESELVVKAAEVMVNRSAVRLEIERYREENQV